MLSNKHHIHWRHSAARTGIMPSAALSSLPLPPSVQLKLAAAGFSTVSDLDGLPPAELAEELGIDHREAQKLLGQVLRSVAVPSPREVSTKSALQLLQEERDSLRLSTFVKDLDDLLGGGGVGLRQLTGKRCPSRPRAADAPATAPSGCSAHPARPAPSRVRGGARHWQDAARHAARRQRAHALGLCRVA